MEVSPNALRRDTVQVYTKANGLLEEVVLDDGLTKERQNELIASLLQTKSQCLNTLTLLSEQSKRK